MHQQSGRYHAPRARGTKASRTQAAKNALSLKNALKSAVGSTAGPSNAQPKRKAPEIPTAATLPAKRNNRSSKIQVQDALLSSAPAPTDSLASSSSVEFPEEDPRDGVITSTVPVLTQGESKHQSDIDSDEEILFRLPSASERKLAEFQELLPLKTKSDTDSQYVLVHKSVLQDCFRQFYCPFCKKMSLLFGLGDRQGFSFQMKCDCQQCGENIFCVYSSQRQQNNTSSKRPGFRVNRSMTEAFLSCGLGHAGMESFGEAMGMQVLSSRAFTLNLHAFNQDIAKFKLEVMTEAILKVRKAYEDQDPSVKSKKVINISVTYDGTWQKRGFTSLYGLGFVIDVLTGLVIDFVVLSKYCYSCVIAEKQYGAGTDEFRQWEQKHKESGHCNKNYEGSSPAMEMAAAAILWKRSVQNCSMQYTVMLSDGDSKTHSHLVELKPYGPDVTISKEECINHVAKRLSAGLKKLVSDCRVKGITLGGSGEGQLTEKSIAKFCSYFRKALEENSESVENMKKAVMATVHHCSSTDKKHNHNLCPTGATSWCFFNKAKASKEKPKSHSEMSLKINATVLHHIQPVYKRLTEDELLQRCQRGGTQNTNESLHGLLWKKCPKELFVSIKRLEIAAVLAASQFNMGRAVSLQVKRCSAGEEVSGAAAALATSADHRRCKKSAEALETNKFQRKQARKEKNAQEKKKMDKEGVTYSAGGF